MFFGETKNWSGTERTVPIGFHTHHRISNFQNALQKSEKARPFVNPSQHINNEDVASPV
jgi:hypothetical protein